MRSVSQSRSSEPQPAQLMGFKSGIKNVAGKNYAFYSAGGAESVIPNLSTTTVSFKAVNTLDIDEETGEYVNEKPTAADTVNGVYLDNDTNNICIARDGQCAVEIGSGTAIGNLVEVINNLKGALTAVKAAVSDSSTDDAGKFAAIAAALGSF